MTTHLNPFPPRWQGLWRVKATPYYFKECWPEAPFGDRWRRMKQRLREPVVVTAGGTP